MVFKTFQIVTITILQQIQNTAFIREIRDILYIQRYNISLNSLIYAVFCFFKKVPWHNQFRTIVGIMLSKRTHLRVYKLALSLYANYMLFCIHRYR